VKLFGTKHILTISGPKSHLLLGGATLTKSGWRWIKTYQYWGYPEQPAIYLGVQEMIQRLHRLDAQNDLGWRFQLTFVVFWRGLEPRTRSWTGRHTMIPGAPISGVKLSSPKEASTFLALMGWRIAQHFHGLLHRQGHSGRDSISSYRSGEVGIFEGTPSPMGDARCAIVLCKKNNMWFRDPSSNLETARHRANSQHMLGMMIATLKKPFGRWNIVDPSKTYLKAMVSSSFGKQLAFNRKKHRHFSQTVNVWIQKCPPKTMTWVAGGGLSLPFCFFFPWIDESYDIGYIPNLSSIISPIYHPFRRYFWSSSKSEIVFFVRTPKPALKASWSWGWLSKDQNFRCGKAKKTHHPHLPHFPNLGGIKQHALKLGLQNWFYHVDNLSRECKITICHSFTDKLPMFDYQRMDISIEVSWGLVVFHCFHF